MRGLLLHISLIFYIGSFAQKNLVPNGDFENSVKEFPCSWLVSESIHEYITDWYTPIGTSTDLFGFNVKNTCWTYPTVAGPGAFTPRSGNNTLGIINYTPTGGCNSEWHEYASVELLEPLTPGAIYCVEFWVQLGANCTLASGNIGALFTLDRILREDCHPILTTPQVNRPEPVLHTEGWVAIKGTFVADEAFKFLTIGNFFSHKETSVLNINTLELDDVSIETPLLVRTESRAYTYYYIDDVSVIACQMTSR